MTSESGIDWGAWLERWERFQDSYVPERKAQFEMIAEYAVAFEDEGSLIAVDLCAGPGSLGAMVQARRPSANVVAIDVDPFLVELGRLGRPSVPIEWVHADLRLTGWSGAVRRPCDVALCATAMHWFDDEQSRALYREAASIIRRNGAMLISDTFPQGTPAVRALTRGRLGRLSARRQADGTGESWVSFWRAVESEPAFAELVAERTTVLGPRGPRVAPPLEFHLEALTDAGFSEVGEIWRRDAWAVILAIR